MIPKIALTQRTISVQLIVFALLTLTGCFDGAEQHPKDSPKIRTDSISGDFNDQKEIAIDFDIEYLSGYNDKLFHVEFQIFNYNLQEWVVVDHEHFEILDRIKRKLPANEDGEPNDFANFTIIRINPRDFKAMWDEHSYEKASMLKLRAYNHDENSYWPITSLNIPYEFQWNSKANRTMAIVSPDLYASSEEEVLDRDYAIEFIGPKEFIEPKIIVRKNEESNGSLDTENDQKEFLNNYYFATRSLGYTRVLPDWPKNVGNYLTNRMQGMTNDRNNWFFSSAGRFPWYPAAFHHPSKIFFFWKRRNLTDDSQVGGVVSNPFPGWYHPGGMSHSGISGYHSHPNELYIALHHTGDASRIALIPNTYNLGFYDKRHYRTFSIPLKRVPWVAYDKRTDQLYTSEFYDKKPGGNSLRRFKIERTHHGTPYRLTDCGTIIITNLGSHRLYRVQGGEFSPSGKLYLSMDVRDSDDIKRGAIRVIQIDRSLFRNGKECSYGKVDSAATLVTNIYLEKRSGSSFGDEVEDITVWDIGTDNFTGRDLGNIHTLLIDQDFWNYDDLYLKHHKVPHSDL